MSTEKKNVACLIDVNVKIRRFPVLPRNILESHYRILLPIAVAISASRRRQCAVADNQIPSGL